MVGKMIMSILFTTAVYTTFTDVTNMSVGDAMRKYEEKVENGTSMLTEKMLAQFRKIENLKEEAVNGQKSNVLDLEQFPVKKVVATGYTAGEESTGKTEEDPAYGITYAGVPVVRDLISTIAADLDVFPLGTILYIPGYGLGVVTDIGAAITGNKIDLYFDTVREVYDIWGKQELDVYIIKEGDGAITEEEIAAWNDGEVQEVFQVNSMERDS